MPKNAKDEIIINALLTYPTTKQASEATGIPEATIYLKLRNDNFKIRYNEAKQRIVENAVAFLQVKLQEATAVIINIMNNPEVAAQTRLNAARSVFDYCIKLTEQTELLQRVENLEMLKYTDN